MTIPATPPEKNHSSEDTEIDAAIGRQPTSAVILSIPTALLTTFVLHSQLGIVIVRMGTILLNINRV